jgi:hypothetical protein
MSTSNEAIASKAVDKITWLHDEHGKKERMIEIILASIEEAHKQGYSEGWHQACVMDLKAESRAAQPQEWTETPTDYVDGDGRPYLSVMCGYEVIATGPENTIRAVIAAHNASLKKTK